MQTDCPSALPCPDVDQGHQIHELGASLIAQFSVPYKDPQNWRLCQRT